MTSSADALSPTYARNLGRWVGIFYIVTFVTSIPALLLYQPVLGHPRYVVGSGNDNQIYLAALLELVLIVANIATAVVLYPLVRRQHPVASLGYVTARVLECVFIAVGILSVLTIVTLRTKDANSEALIAVSQAFIALKDWTFLLGPGIVVGIGNGLLLGWMMYRTGLVPRGMAMFGLVGGPLIVASGIAVMFGVLEQGGVGQGIATIPEFIWEASFGIYLAVTGGRTSHLLASAEAAATELRPLP